VIARRERRTEYVNVRVVRNHLPQTIETLKVVLPISEILREKILIV